MVIYLQDFPKEFAQGHTDCPAGGEKKREGTGWEKDTMGILVNII